MQSPLPAETRVVIIGGGIIGCSLAYHLPRLGCRDVVLLEQNRLAGGTTWHAAGLVGRLRTTNVLTRINKYSAELYAGLERETGHPVGWKQVGSLIAAASDVRMTQLRRTAAMSEWFGVEVQLIKAEEAKERWPLLRTDDLKGAAWLPHDGKVIPQEVAFALAKGAQAQGVTILENMRVLSVDTRDGRATGVTTNQGSIKAEFVVLCGGMWSRELGLRCGVQIPLYPVEHHYLLTEPLEGAFDELPVGRDPDLCLYFRGEGNAVMLGAFQAESKPWIVDRVPDDFSFQLLEPDWEKFAAPLRNGKHRIPALQNCRFAKFVNGPESFTPDNNFILGEAPELKNLYVGAGFNSVGIASAGGAGKYLAEWILQGEAPLDLWSVDIRRFAPWANNRAFLRARVVEVLGLHYQPAWPNREPDTARGIRLSPLHERLAARGACFGVKNGWERPNWFASTSATPPSAAASGSLATQPAVDYSFGRQNWFPNHAREHLACRERVAVFDQSSFGKLRVVGRDTISFLQRLCGNNVDVPVGRVVYTGMFNRKGGYESDLTVVRTGESECLLVTGTAQPIHDLDWLRRQRSSTEHVEMIDVTGNFGVIGVMGPDARTLVSRVTDTDLSNKAFPFGTSREIAIGMSMVRAVRITYVGELGWELHIPVDQTRQVYDELLKAGADLGLTDAGYYALNSLRLEKGYRAWGAELSPDDSPMEAGLGFTIDWNKDFIGRDALLARKNAPLKRRLVILVLEEDSPVLWGGEVIYCDGRPVGFTTSGAYGHTLGRAVGMGYLNQPALNHVEGPALSPVEGPALSPVEGPALSSVEGPALSHVEGRYEISINGERVSAQVHLRAPYDPGRSRILA